MRKLFMGTTKKEKIYKKVVALLSFIIKYYKLFSKTLFLFANIAKTRNDIHNNNLTSSV